LLANMTNWDADTRHVETAAGLGVLMAEDDGLSQLVARTVAAAAARSRELRG
jgi:pyrroline-5-carboxylate reductase